MIRKPLGDSAWLLEFQPSVALSQVVALARAIRAAAPPCVRDVVSSYASIAVHTEPSSHREIGAWLDEFQLGSSSTFDGISIHEIPVCYDGEDLQTTAELLALTIDELIDLHQSAIYTVAAIGFTPGFPYLTGLPPRLHLPRKHTPRLKIPAGSVAIAGNQTGIYPCESPGGWNLLGKTNFALFDPLANPPNRLQVGDQVRFIRVPFLEQNRNLTATHSNSIHDSNGVLEILQSGSQTALQRLPRHGRESAGIGPGGAVDPQALDLANRLVGNSPDTWAMECCLSGPIIRFHRDVTYAQCDGHGRLRQASAGEVVNFSNMSGSVRSVIAFAGGISVPENHAQPLQISNGMWLALGLPSRTPRVGDWFVGWPSRRSHIQLRFLRGVQADWFSDQIYQNLTDGIFQLSPRSDRMGARLTGAPLHVQQTGQLVSQPVACGSVQVPPDGQPIVLMAGRQTIGGYPQIAHVISTDLSLLARAWPGTWIQFCEVSLDQAYEIHRQSVVDLGKIQCAIDLLKS